MRCGKIWIKASWWMFQDSVAGGAGRKRCHGNQSRIGEFSVMWIQARLAAEYFQVVYT